MLKRYLTFTTSLAMVLSILAAAPAKSDYIWGFGELPDLTEIETSDGDNFSTLWTFDGGANLEIHDAFADYPGGTITDAFDSFGELWVSADDFATAFEVDIDDTTCDFQNGDDLFGGSETGTVTVAEGETFSITCESEPIQVSETQTAVILGTLDIKGSWARWTVEAQSDEDIESLSVAIGGNLGSDDNSHYTYSGLADKTLVSSQFSSADPILGYRSTTDSDVNFGYGEEIAYSESLEAMVFSSAPMQQIDNDPGHTYSDNIYAWTSGISVSGGDSWTEVHSLEVAVLGFEYAGIDSEADAASWHCAHYTVAPDALANDAFGTYISPVEVDDARCAEDNNFAYVTTPSLTCTDLATDLGGTVAPDANVNGVFEIGSAAELLWLSLEVADVDLGADYLLTADIDLKNCVSWSPIGYEVGEDFTGTFDGGGYSISGMVLSDLDNLGLVGVLSGSGSISNLTLVGPRVFNEDSDHTSTGFFAGQIADEASVSDLTLIDGFMYFDEVGAYEVGGVVGTHSGTGSISNVSIEATIDARDAGSNIGGIVGYATDTADFAITDSAFYGILTGVDHVGGIIGQSSGEGATVEILRSSSSGSLHSYDAGGGIAGQLQLDSSITSSWSTMVLAGEDEDFGGLVGSMHDDTSISKSYFDGAVISDDGSIGGLIGHMFGGTISESYALGRMHLRSDTDWGGLVGYLSYGTIENSFSMVEMYIDSGDEVGGLVGNPPTPSSNQIVSTSFFGGAIFDVDGNIDSVGSVIGYEDYPTYLAADALYWNSDLSSYADEFATGLTSEEMLLCSSFSGFDFASVWSFAADGTSTHPELRWTVEDPEYWDNGCTNAVYSSNARAYEGPRVINVSATTVPQGTDLVLSGTQMDLVTEVMAGSEALEIKLQTATTATVHVPADAKLGLADLALTAVNGTVVFRRAIEVVPGTEAIAATSKVNVGSFNGKIVVYAKGLAGSTLSWKIAGKWVTVEVTKDYQFFDRLTIAVGLPVNVDIYVDSTKRLSKTVLTR